VSRGREGHGGPSAIER